MHRDWKCVILGDVESSEYLTWKCTLFGLCSAQWCEDCSETCPGCLCDILRGSLRRLKQSKIWWPRFGGLCGEWLGHPGGVKMPSKWHSISDTKEWNVVSLSYCISISQPLYAMLIIALLHNHLNDSFTWFLTGTSLVIQRAFHALKFGKIDPNFSLKNQFQRSS